MGEHHISLLHSETVKLWTRHAGLTDMLTIHKQKHGFLLPTTDAAHIFPGIFQPQLWYNQTEPAGRWLHRVPLWDIFDFQQVVEERLVCFAWWPDHDVIFCQPIDLAVYENSGALDSCLVAWFHQPFVDVWHTQKQERRLRPSSLFSCQVRNAFPDAQYVTACTVLNMDVVMLIWVLLIASLGVPFIIMSCYSVFPM